MSESDREEHALEAEGREVEGGGQSSGVPAEGAVDVGANEPLGGSGQHHWRESSITQPGFDQRGNIFFAAVEMTRMPMCITDPNQADNPVVFVNRAFLDLTGYEEHEVTGRNCRFLQGAQTDRETVAELRAGIEEQRAVSVEILNYKRDGTPFWNAVFVGPVFDAEGRLLYFFSSQLDVTRRRNSEQAFRQSQKMEAVGQLTAGLAHDFNNLLQVVSGNLEVLDSRIDDERHRRYLRNAAMAADKGARLTRQLLAFARKTRLEPRPIHLSRLITDFGEIIQSTLGSKIDLQLNLRQRLPLVLLDPNHLEMALLNVLLNARDAMGDGGVVTVSTRTLHLNGDAAARELMPGDYVVLEVQDEGEGMPPHVLERAAEPFFTTKTDGKGTGLGLAMATGFVQQSRGRLELESAPGQGALVRMIFPVAALREDALTETRPSVGAESSGSGDNGERILVVEDNDDVLELAKDILGGLGYRLVTARSGEEALRLFDSSQERFDLVFSDLVMPGGINGLKLAEEVSRRAPGLPVLLTTGYNEELSAEGPARGAMDVIGKPYRRAELADRVRQALRRRGVQPERRQPSETGPAQA